MYEVLDYSKFDIASIYFVIVAASILITPLANLVLYAVKRGVDR